MHVMFHSELSSDHHHLPRRLQSSSGIFYFTMAIVVNIEDAAKAWETAGAT
jgi:hypothetical protein